MIRFAQITDHHLAEGDLLWGYSTWHALRVVLRHIAEHAGRLDFIVSTGDLTEHGSEAEYRIFCDLLGAAPGGRAPGPLRAYGAGLAGTPLYLLPGNHDVRPTMLRCLFPASPPAERLHGWFEHGGLRFICLDWGPANQATWDETLADALAGALADGAPAILLMHHHVAPMGHGRLDRLLPERLDALAALIAGRDVRAILSGHTHATFERSFAGVPVYGLRSTCFQFAPQGEESLLRCLLPPHYRVVTIDGDQLSSEIVEVPL